MASSFFVNAWGNDGKKYILHIPIDYYIQGSGSATQYDDIQSIAEATALEPAFDHTYTLFTNSHDSQRILTDMGFTNVIVYSDIGSGQLILTLPSKDEHQRYIDWSIAQTHPVQRLWVDDTQVYQWAVSNVQNYCATVVSPGTVSNQSMYISHIEEGRLSGIPEFDLSRTPALTHQTVQDFWSQVDTFQPNDPYDPGNISESGGGDGDFIGTNYPVDFSTVPTLSATDSGFITLFNPSLAQLQALATYLWSSFPLDIFKKLFSNPMDCILGLSIVPINVPSGGTREVKVGNVGTGINMTTASTQYVTVNCGSINLHEYWGAYLDYSPYTKLEIYLPYIGTHALNIDDCMGKTLEVQYMVDILSGACICEIKCGNHVLYNFIGQCASVIPITGQDFSNVVNGIINIAGSIGSMVATGGATAPLAVPNMVGTVANSFKPEIEKSGSCSGTAGLMGIQKPYLILTRPKQCKPAEQNTFTGYPSYITSRLSTLSGYTKVHTIHLDNVDATEQEKAEIESLLKSGVII